MKKLVNGVEVICSQEEEAEILASWAANAPDNLENSKNRKLSELASGYETAIHAPITYNGITYQADEASISNLIKMLQAYPATVPPGFFWVAADNSQVSFTRADLVGLAKVLADRGWAAFQNLQAKKAAVRNASDVAIVNSVTW